MPDYSVITVTKNTFFFTALIIGILANVIIQIVKDKLASNLKKAQKSPQWIPTFTHFLSWVMAFHGIFNLLLATILGYIGWANYVGLEEAPRFSAVVYFSSFLVIILLAWFMLLLIKTFKYKKAIQDVSE